MITTDHLNILKKRLSALNHYFDIDGKKIEITNQEEKTYPLIFGMILREQKFI